LAAKSTSCTQPAALQQPKPGPVEQVRHQPRHALESLQDRPDLVAGEDDWQPFRSHGAHDAIQPREIDFQHPAIEKQQRAQGLVLSGARDLPLDRQRREEARHLGRSHLGGMALTMEQDESADPADVGLLGAAAHVASADGPADAIQETRCPRLGGTDLADHL
jgi:hypothetical protein